MPKFLTQSDYLLRETWLGIRRGGWMNWAAISTVAVLLLLLGLSLQLGWQVGHLLNQFGNQLEISVYLNTGVGAESLRSAVRRLPEVALIEAVPKEQAWANLVKDLGGSELQNAIQQLGGNPLVDELRVKARSAAAVAPLADQLKRLPGVSSVQYVAEAVQRIGQLHRGLNGLSLLVTGMLTVTAMAVITTTIRLIVVARQREIEVMQLVGATTAWIYLPFLLQGVTFGLVGAGLAWGLIQGVQAFLGNLLAQQPELLKIVAMDLQPSLLERWALPLILLGFGGLLGLFGSLLAVRNAAPR
jgi:cell division transport system permease protein